MALDVLKFLGIFLLCWLGVGGGIVYLVDLLRFQLPLSRKLEAEGVYGPEVCRNLMKTGRMGCLITIVVPGFLAAWLMAHAGWMGILMAVLGVGVGLLRGRHVLAGGTERAARFIRTHGLCMDREKAKAFFQREYSLDFDRLLPKE